MWRFFGKKRTVDLIEWLCLFPSSLRFICCQLFIKSWVDYIVALPELIWRFVKWIRDGQFRKEFLFSRAVLIRHLPASESIVWNLLWPNDIDSSHISAKENQIIITLMSNTKKNHYNERRPSGGIHGGAWQKTANRGSKLTLADTFYFTTWPLWTHLCYFCSLCNCISSRCSTFKKHPKD